MAYRSWLSALVSARRRVALDIIEFNGQSQNSIRRFEEEEGRCEVRERK